MLGSGKSSASIWTAFNSVVTSVVRQIKFSLKIAWNRVADSNVFGIVGSSTVDNCLVQGQLSALTPTDSFKYFDETERAMKLSYDRQIYEPLGGISYALADITLENSDKRFSPNYNSTVGTALLENRPLQMYFGFYVSSVNKTLPVFKGVTKELSENKQARTFTIKAIDFIEYLRSYKLEKETYISQRSDEIIEDILISSGIGASQYSLDVGFNTIGYASFDTGDTAASRIQQICEAEDGHFFQDEEGILRFHNRSRYQTPPYSNIQWTIDKDDILSWEKDSSVKMINKCIVIANPREVSAQKTLWTYSIVEDIEPGETVDVWALFDNPVTEIVDPLVASTDYTANSQSDGGGSDLTSNISITAYLFSTSCKLEVTNNGPTKAYMTLLQIRGKEATIIQKIQKEWEDADMINKYGEQLKTIENDFIDDPDFARSLSQIVVAKYKNPFDRYKIQIRGNPCLQLKDKVRVWDKDAGEYVNFRIVRIQGSMSGGSFIQHLIIRKITGYEAVNWAVVGSSAVDGVDVVGV